MNVLPLAQRVRDLGIAYHCFDCPRSEAGYRAALEELLAEVREELASLPPAPVVQERVAGQHEPGKGW